MEISQKGINLIKEFEGCSLTAYKCVAEKWTIGYGHTEGVDPNTKPITQQKAEEYLKEDLKYFENCVNNKYYVPQKINQNQFDALVSFAFNLFAAGWVDDGGGNWRYVDTDNTYITDTIKMSGNNKY